MKRLSREIVLAYITGIILIIGNSWHILLAGVMNMPGYVFTGIAHYYADYFLYVSLIAQGGRGALIWTDHLFTNERLSPTWIYWVYTIIGKGQGLGLTPFALYSISLLFFSGLLLYTWWRISQKLFPNQPITGSLAFLFLTTASHIPNVGEFWFSPTPALNRLGGVPHQMLQSILLLGVIIFFVKLLTDKRHHLGSSVLFIVLSFWAAMANPIQMLLVVISASITGIWVIKTTKDHLKNAIVAIVLLAVPALLGAVLTNISFAHDPILTAAKVWEDSQRVSVGFAQFIFAIGPIALLIPFGIRQVFR